MALATVEFANGALGVIEATTAVYPGYLKRIEIHGTEGSAAIEEEDLVKWDFLKKKPRDAAVAAMMARHTSGGGGAADPAAIGHHAHARQFQDVVNAIKKGIAPAIDGPGGRIRSKSFWRFTNRPRPAKRSSCRCRATRSSVPESEGNSMFELNTPLHRRVDLR